MDEAHVEHAIGLVEHEDLELVQVHHALLAEVEQAAGRGDEDVDARAQDALLLALSDAAEDDGVTVTEVLAVRGEALADLRGQLTRRRQHEDRDRAVAMRAAAGE